MNHVGRVGGREKKKEAGVWCTGLAQSSKGVQTKWQASQEGK